MELLILQPKYYVKYVFTKSIEASINPFIVSPSQRCDYIFDCIWKYRHSQKNRGIFRVKVAQRGVHIIIGYGEITCDRRMNFSTDSQLVVKFSLEIFLKSEILIALSFIKLPGLTVFHEAAVFTIKISLF